VDFQSGLTVDTADEGLAEVREPTSGGLACRALTDLHSRLDNAAQCSFFVLMEVETLGMARSLGWRVHMRCAQGYREGTKSMRRRIYRKQLDLDTLVCTRGPNFPLSRLESRLMCPACGSRSITVVFEPPTNRQVGGG
jgi:hypothetical protein